MLEELFNLVKNESQNEIINNPAIPDEHNNHAVGMATESIFGGLQNALANGGLQNVLGMFTGAGNTGASNPIVGGIINNLVGGLMSKFGINNSAATSIASSIVPSVLGKLVNKTNDPNDSGFNLNGIIGSLIGGGTSAQSTAPVQLPGVQTQAQDAGGIDFGGMLKNIAGGALDTNHSGGIDMGDLAGIIGKVTGSQQQNQQAGGGVMDLLKGFLGN